MGNILENTVECTCEEFVAEIAGKRRKPYLDALKSTFKTIVLGKSTLVKEMSSFLRENEGRLERKRVQELMSGWLNAYDFAALLNPCLLARSAADVTDEATLAVDFSDISKEFGGDGMEGMEMGCDGSRRCTAMGHDFISVSLVGAAYREAFPVYAKLGMGRHCHADLIYGAIRAVMEGTGGLGWLVFDRGMDDARFLRTMKRDGRKAVVRVKDEGRDVFGDGRTVGALGQRRGHRAEDAFASRGHPDPGVEGPNTLHQRETEDEGAPAAGPADARPADCGRKRVPPVAGDEVGAGEDGRANGCGEHCDGGWKVRPSGQARNPA